MKLRRIDRGFLCAGCALAASSAGAQVAVYATFSPTHLSNVETGAVYSATGYTEQTASYWTSGIGGGITVGLLHLPVVSLGLDLRGSTRPGTAGVDSALIGLKLGVHPPRIHLRPYVQASGGYVDTRTTNVTSGPPTVIGTTVTVGGTFTNKYAAYEILGGLDYPLIHLVDIRLVEIGAGRGVGNGSYNPTFVTVNSGVVLHF